MLSKEESNVPLIDSFTSFPAYVMVVSENVTLSPGWNMPSGYLSFETQRWPFLQADPDPAGGAVSPHFPCSSPASGGALPYFCLNLSAKQNPSQDKS